MLPSKSYASILGPSPRNPLLFGAGLSAGFLGLIPGEHHLPILLNLGLGDSTWEV